MHFFFSHFKLLKDAPYFDSNNHKAYHSPLVAAPHKGGYNNVHHTSKLDEWSKIFKTTRQFLNWRTKSTNFILKIS